MEAKTGSTVNARLHDRTVVVTGASSGIGRALALELRGAGCRVVGAARSTARLAELGSGVLAVPCDVTDKASVLRLAERARAEYGPVDAVVNNAAVGSLEPFVASDERSWRAVIETNLFGALRVTRAFLPDMVGAGRGVIVNVGSAGASGWPYLVPYAASKAGLYAASVALDREYRARGVRVLSVEVGNTIGTEFASGFDPELFATAGQLWTELGIEWSSPIVTPEESARRILDAIEAALV